GSAGIMRLYEDGFVILLPASDWRAMRQALMDGRTFTFQAPRSEIETLHIHWRRPRAQPARGAGFSMGTLVFYQNEEILTERVTNVGALSAFTSQLQGTVEDFLVDDHIPAAFDVFVMIRPDRRSRVWFASSQDTVSGARLAVLRDQLE